MNRNAPLRRVGAMWKPKPGAKCVGSGSMTIDGMKQGFVVMLNNRQKPGSKEPDYVLLSSDEPEPDPYARGHQTREPEADGIDDDDIPF